MLLDEQYEFRRQLVEALVRDTVGPAHADEIISDPPVTRYIAGVLFPLTSGVLDPEQDIDPLEEGETDSEEIARPDPPVAKAHVRYPSSMGLTFAIDTRAAQSVTIRVAAARYAEVSEGEASAPSERSEESISPDLNTSHNPHSNRWQRIPLKISPHILDVTTPRERGSILLSEGLELFSRVRKPNKDGISAVTLVVINRLASPPRGIRDAFAFFQTEIEVTATSPAFVDRHTSLLSESDPDLKSYHLLYQHTAAFAIGHGCSVTWDVLPNLTARTFSVRTTIVPQHEVPVAESNPQITGDILQMRLLAFGDRSRILGDLQAFCDAYATWIDERRTEANAFEPGLKEIAAQHLIEGDIALKRMKGGVTLLQSNGAAWEAFQLANHAMLQARARKKWIDGDRPEAGPLENSSHAWYPFQLAFFLVCLESLTLPDSTDRSVADLLWFPTGGGKTEAYLGLIAYTAFLRRLRPDNRPAGGVTVIMRYTLRLLTTQQFERATSVICSCEAIRRSRPQLGEERISIGLWIGRRGAPNTIQKTRIALDKLRHGQPLAQDEGNPMQLKSCPWCGSQLQAKHYYITATNPHLVIGCRTPECLFAAELPVFVIDEDIYRFRPTLLIATIDKFATLPWRDKVGSLFSGTGPLGRPPELIIQDELHLISGPLGTLAGLYETAIDLLCTDGGVPPKVVASTATIRRASAQTLSLFDREVRQFPPAGLDARDSYFAVEAPRDRRGARLFVGLMSPHTSQTTLLVRAYSALLQYAASIPAKDKVRDPYWTLVGYFNSLRILGGARMQVQDDVDDRMLVLANETHTAQRNIDDNRIELTSREPSGDIPDHLRRMAIQLPSPDTLNVILATNMISVGVDIDRLGMMVMMGQPPSTSEYIQATSRVGRQFPGLVITLYNSSRSRDRSHYERFIDYHSALYRQVESTSVTPFSARARDRGLHAVLIALARLTIPELAAHDAAGRVEEVRNKVNGVAASIVQRVSSVAPDEQTATAHQLQEIIEDWIRRARQEPNLVYDDQYHPDRALMVSTDRRDSETDSFATLWSLRDVDAVSALYQIR